MYLEDELATAKVDYRMSFSKEDTAALNAVKQRLVRAYDDLCRLAETASEKGTLDSAVQREIKSNEVNELREKYVEALVTWGQAQYQNLVHAGIAELRRAGVIPVIDEIFSLPNLQESTFSPPNWTPVSSWRIQWSHTDEFDLFLTEDGRTYYRPSMKSEFESRRCASSPGGTGQVKFSNRGEPRAYWCGYPAKKPQGRDRCYSESRLGLLDLVRL